MKNLLDSFNKKTPHYPNIYKESILDRFSRKGGGSEEEKFSQGKYFSNYYECFMYAALLGIRNNYKIPFDRAKEGTKFIEVEYWKPQQIAQYILMSLLALTDIDFNKVEDLDETQIDEKAFTLVVELEEYAHGGFDLIKSKMEVDSNYFESPFAAINFLKN